MEEHLPGFEFQQFVDSVKEMPMQQKVFECVKNNDVNGLKRANSEGINWNWDNGVTTLLQLACTHGNDRTVEFLLKRCDCDPNLITAAEGRTPALIAAHYGYFKVLDILKQDSRVNFKQVEKDTGKTVLHEVLLKCDTAKNIIQEDDGCKASYVNSLKVLLGKSYASNPCFEHQIDSIINYQEKLEGNTALHYATMQSDQDIIKLLLCRGANMGVKNFGEKTPVQNILPVTLKEVLDDCIKSEGIITNEEFKITFKYNFLTPPILNEDMLFQYQQANSQERRPLPETEALWYLSTASKDHRSLLKHPVISSFLWLKWQRIRTIFYLNIFAYLCFVTLLTSFILLQFGGYI